MLQHMEGHLLADTVKGTLGRGTLILAILSSSFKVDMVFIVGSGI